MLRKPPKTAVNARGGGPRREERPIYRQTPNFRADASRKSGSSLGAGVELGESFSAPASPASNASGEETADNAGFGRRKYSWSLGDIIRARTTVVAPNRPADVAETNEKTAVNARGGGPRREERPIYRQTPNFRADASRKSGSSLGAGVELGESFSAPASPASNASGEETADNAGFGRRKISWSLGDIIRARTTVVAPNRPADVAETPENSGKCKRGRAASGGATNIPTDAKF